MLVQNTCYYCKYTFTTDTLQIKSSYGWLVCPNCTKLFAHHYVDTKPPRTEDRKLGGVYNHPPNHPEIGISFIKPQTKFPWLWWVLSGLLFLCLAILSYIFIERHYLVAIWPELKPYILAICQPINDCSIKPYQNEALLLISSHTLTTVPKKPNTFELQINLQNTGHWAYVATPSLEIHIVNWKSQVIGSLSLSPQELGIVQPSLRPLESLAVTTTFTIPSGSDSVLNTIGYELNLFYPD
jgi:hypothetical protein